MTKEPYQKGRGAQVNPHNRFAQNSYRTEEQYLEHLHKSGEPLPQAPRTRTLKVKARTLVNKVNSPDIGKSWSMNPYQGCEHGCTYCYARNSHEYWGYSAGTDFETQILVKENAPALLEHTLQKPGWKPEPIMLSGNTDCYQPVEKEWRLTRKLLQLCLKYRQPVGVITKNALIQRDVDVLQQMAALNLVHVSISVTTLEESLRRKMEPRTATVKRKLETIKLLSQNNIPVNIMMAPLIPGINSHEIMAVAEATAQAGACRFEYTTVRLNGQIAEIFMDWLRQNFPDRVQKVKHQIEELHGGKLNDSQFGRRMKGSGALAENLAQTVALARKKHFTDKVMPEYNSADFLRLPRGQYSLF